MKKSELRALLEAASSKQFSRAVALQGSENPQVIEAQKEHAANYHALQAVIEALDAPRPTAAYNLQQLTR